ncbi:hypothetical protein [Acidithiobacillus caldus]|uniref:Type IV pilus biogenesis protein PilP n=1 Tax=Acidithiobacillus caldus TaxID=33059 RepID=A0A1E7YPR5_9PROT|nr:hypothetical protein [Acidithiobacillus caldus]OFC37951.1 hypothetical protein BAE27_03130 [Acidithiobacillus caldus]OFC38433.1 hypothetical protein BAE28_05455 [Acidithiobacillus caldus]
MKAHLIFTRSLLTAAVLSTCGVSMASANTAGINAILAAAAGNKTAVPAAITAPVQSVKSMTKPVAERKPNTAAPIAVKKPVVLPHTQPAHPVHKEMPSTVVHPVAATSVPKPQTVAHTAQPMMHPTKADRVLPFRNVRPEPSMVPPAHPSASPVAQETAGYINPFMGVPSHEQDLSNRLALLKIKTQIAKEQATYAKYAHETNLIETSASPQMQQLQERVSDLQTRLARLEQKVHHTFHAVHAMAKKKAEKARETPILASILADMNQRSAIIKVGKHLHTVTVGDRIAGQRVMAIHLHSVQLSNGDVLHLQAPIGHYQSTTWQSSQAQGRIAAPRADSLVSRLAEEARQSGIRLPSYGATNSSGMPPLPALNPSMLRHPGQP